MKHPIYNPMFLLLHFLIAIVITYYGPITIFWLLPISRNSTRSPFHSILLLILLGAASLITLTLFLQPNRLWAALLCMPWLATTVYAAFLRSRFICARSSIRLEEIVLDLSLIFATGGAVWIFMYTTKLTLLGFSGVQSLLTAEHFNYTGFGACVVAGLLGRMRWTNRLRWLYCFAVLFLVSGIPLLALGITFSHTLEHIAAWLLLLGVVLLGFLMLLRALQIHSFIGKIFATASGLAAWAASGFALWFSWKGFNFIGVNRLWIMLLGHGLTNAIGFIGLGLLSFYVEPISARTNTQHSG